MMVLDGLEAKTGDFRLGPIDLQLPTGASHALLGPSGAGKSTLLKLLLGLEIPSAGEIRFKGKEISQTPVEVRGFGYLPQHLALFPHLDVVANLRYGLKARGLHGDPYEQHLQRLIEATGIAPLLKRKPETLSGGERQRVALVRALAPKPELLLLDEPFSALDPALRRELWDLTRSLQRLEGTTMLLITHDMEEAFALADRIHLIIGGKIRQEGTPAELWEHPADLESARYLGLRNLFRIQSFDRDSLRIRLEGFPQELIVARENWPVTAPKWCAIRAENLRFVQPEENVPNRLTLRAVHRSGPGVDYWNLYDADGKLLLEMKGVAEDSPETQQRTVILPPKHLLLFP
ncbi:ABC transporter ATP-binding protein [Nitratifractor sp.]|uniref:ABC transporter ATP-binding protein n=1 Tax=Nitratifractor sp. TaxID=2268144 RepID=UPI0025E2D262|nr:ABC transporter ATP-binding protein [Nitratifractor sp.]